jgi:DNA modification methylase
MTEPVIERADARNLGVLGLSEGSVDCFVTSPPYWDLECFSLAKPTGVMWLVLDTLRASDTPGLGELIPLPFELSQEASRHGWRLQEIVVWEKNKTLPYSGQGKLRNLIEYVLFLTKSQDFKHRPYRCAERHRPGAEWLAGWPERYHPLGRRPSNIWRIDIDTQGIWKHTERLHYCPFPQALVARCLELSTDKGDVVVDPFAGVGTVVAQAVAMGRRGYGVELNRDSIDAFKTRVLPAFQAHWEQEAEERRLARLDQLTEAKLILQLRLLKAGKELIRLIDRLAQSRSAKHPAASVESVLVLEPDGLAECIDVERGHVARPNATLVILASLEDNQMAELRQVVEPSLGEPPFSTFGIDFELRLMKPERAEDATTREINHFGQSRHGAYTGSLDETHFSSRPRLLTTVALPTAISGDRSSALDETRERAERRLLEEELSKGYDQEEIAMRLGITRAELHNLLLQHGLVSQPRSFAISLPEPHSGVTEGS